MYGAIVVGIFIFCFGGLYLLIKIVDKKGNPLKRIWYWLVAIISSSVLSLIAFYFLIFFYLFEFDLTFKPFSAEGWRDEPTKRSEMVDDLMKRKLLDSLTREEVVALLGDSVRNSPNFKEMGRDILYHLGPLRGPAPTTGSEWLLIWLDSGRVKRYAVYTTDQ